MIVSAAQLDRPSGPSTVVRDHRRRVVDLRMFALGLALVAIIAATSLFAAEHGDALTRNSIRLSFAWYVVALFGWLRLRPSDWHGATTRWRLVRCCWTWAIICYLAHVAAAFHYTHHWSHDHAFEHTRKISGIGEGLYVSYLFTIVWTADVLWMWSAPTSYSTRSRWIDRALHGFLLFVIFNGTVVYASGPIRVAGIITFSALALFWLRSHGRQRDTKLRMLGTDRASGA